MSVTAIIAAAGSGSRTGLTYNKVFYDMGGVPMICRTISPFLSLECVEKIIITIGASDYATLSNIISTISTDKPIEIVEGGASRMESVLNALQKVETPLVAIHDGARPFVTRELILACVYKAESKGAAIPVIPLSDTIKKISSDVVEFTPIRADFMAVQTPQVFNTEKLKDAYMHSNGDFTDDSSVYECFGGTVFTVEGELSNIKITTPKDLEHIPLHLRHKHDTEGNSFVRIGVGFDAHQLMQGYKLILGGVSIKHDKGLVGHSDADVVVHAIMDAILSAAGLRDIGCYFPDSDEAYRGADSIRLLEQVGQIASQSGYYIGNISAVIMAQQPKLSSHIPEMIKNIADALKINISAVSVAATTTEKLGIIGEEKGIAAQAVASVLKKDEL